MLIHVVEAKYIRDRIVWIKFDNGVEGEINLSEELQGEMFEPLRDPDFFRRFHVDNEINTIVWENGADMAPDFLFSLVQKKQAA
jgi:hypothetical protein